MEDFFRSNKTTLIGIATAAGYAALTVLSGGTWAAKDIAIAVGMAVLGAFSKDFDTSGKK